MLAGGFSVCSSPLLRKRTNFFSQFCESNVYSAQFKPGLRRHFVAPPGTADGFARWVALSSPIVAYSICQQLPPRIVLADLASCARNQDISKDTYPESADCIICAIAMDQLHCPRADAHFRGCLFY